MTGATQDTTVAVPPLVAAFYQAVDTMDSDGLRPLLSADCRFRVANTPGIVGRDAVIEGNRAMTSMFAALAHDIVGVGSDGRNQVFVECWVTYTMRDGATHRLPFTTIFGHRSGLICDVKIFGDMSPLSSAQ